MASDLTLVNKSLSLGSLGAYLHWINQIPMLSQEEEADLATRLQQHNDLEAARKLVLSHLRLVARIARGYSGYGLPQADLIQEGNIGLMKAVKRFDPTVGVRLVSFAIHWIRAEIHEFILKNWRIVKVATTKTQRKLFFNLRKAAKKLGWLSDSEIQVVAEELKVSHQDVRQMEMRLKNHDQSLEGYKDDETHDSDWQAPINFLEDNRSNPLHLLEQSNWSSTREQNLYAALDSLDQRSRDILKQRWLNEDKQTLHDLAAKYNISAERIRQLEKNALLKLRKFISAA